jgi:hypothetical protein
MTRRQPRYNRSQESETERDSKREMKRKFAQNKIENHSHNDYGGTLQVLSKEELHPDHEPKIEERHNKKKIKTSSLFRVTQRR